jgi:transglutaminase-like putative cysteine protease
MRRLKIEHTTTYHFADNVTLLPHRLLIRPREGHDIRIESSKLQISPASKVKWHRDTYGNSVAVVTFDETHNQLSVYSEVVIHHFEEMPLDFLVEDYALHYPFHYQPDERVDLIPYEMTLYPEDSQPLSQWLRALWQPGELIETYALLERINQAIVNDFEYWMREEPGVQSPAVTLSRGYGSCRDFATLFIEACRYIGLAARFVSGYLYNPGGSNKQGSTHAWSEVYLPGAGWKGFDSTTGKIVGHDHIAVAVNRHPEAVPPVAGAFIGITSPEPDMQVTVSVTEQ